MDKLANILIVAAIIILIGIAVSAEVSPEPPTLEELHQEYRETELGCVKKMNILRDRILEETPKT